MRKFTRRRAVLLAGPVMLLVLVSSCSGGSSGKAAPKPSSPGGSVASSTTAAGPSVGPPRAPGSQLQGVGNGFVLNDVTAATRPGGTAVSTTYQASSAPDPVTSMAVVYFTVPASRLPSTGDRGRLTTAPVCLAVRVISGCDGPGRARSRVTPSTPVPRPSP
jgi:hypothetical protein